MLTSRIPLRDEQDQVSGLVSISRDITQRRQDEDQIRNLSLVAENTSNLVVISDSSDLIIWVNTSFLTRTGYTLGEVLGKPVGEILQGPQTDSRHVEMMSQGIAAKKAFRQEILNYTKSGEEIWLEVFVNPVLDVRGNIEKIIAISIDITESKQSEIRLRQSIKSYSDLFNSLDEAIYIQDQKGNILDLNRGALRMYGYSREEVLDKNPDFLCAPFKNHMPVIYEKIKQAYQGQAQKLEFWGMKKNGEIFPKEMHLYPGEFFSQKVVLAVAQDISGRKQSEELKTSLEVAKKTAGLKQQFLANVSHEMRTPMNGVLGMSGILRKTPLNATQLQYLHIIEDSARSMLEIINDVLQLSKIEAGKQEVHQKKINTSDFAHRIQSLFTPLTQNKGLSFSVHIPHTVPKAFISDENKLVQVMNNLIGNAIKFTSQGGIKISLEDFISHEQKNMIRVRVEDTGKGISPEYHGRIFEEFAQVDPTPTREAGGTGLGLTITKRMVELLGGTVGLESQPGKGSTFSFTFSYKKVQESFPSAQAVKSSQEEPQGQLDLSVLLVEDKKVNQMVASLVLKEMGCQVAIADNGLKALEKVKQQQYDVILMDIQMPVMDGVTAVKNLRSMNISLPLIIGLSAEAMEGDAEKYISLGMDDYLTKPLDAHLLYSKLNKVRLKNDQAVGK
ncbi:MAG: PAS domain S-box protein, partial [Bacteroidales bacterium]